MSQKAPVPARKKTATKKPAGVNAFPIVAIGASSGGLEAVTELLQHLPADTGMAYIFVQHLSPDYKSILASLLAKSTRMPVQVIENMELMKPDNVYVIPSDKGIQVTDGHIRLTPRAQKGMPMSIDVLFTSLAETHHENSIGIILSGNASDGTIGLKAIRQAGGITFAQDHSARYGSMPESAISEGVADFILSPREIARELGRISQHAAHRDTVLVGHESKIDDADPDLGNIIALLHRAVGVDFTHYKMNMIKRRILRRMLIYKLKTLRQYTALLDTKPEEVTLLYSDLLIHVTEFFRDAEEWLYLRSTLLPRLLKNKAPGEKLRIWVTGCATGQEAYSIAMLLVEILGEKMAEKQVQVFASDLGGEAIKKARAGEYTRYEVRSVSAKRLAHFFTRSDNKYKIIKSVRDLCAFAPHNVLGDPPFSRIDFISCRNMLIYLTTPVHKKVLSTFHYVLNEGGCLMLGKSETTGTSKLFTAIDTKHKIYARTKGIRTLPDLISRSTRPPAGQRPEASGHKKSVFDPAATEAAIQAILHTRYLPAYVVINQALEIVQFKGATSDYLEHGTGRATLNILTMARPEIAYELRDAIHQAAGTQREVHRAGIEMKKGNQLHTLSLDVMPLPSEEAEPLLLVIFTMQVAPGIPEGYTQAGRMTEAKGGIQKLQAELAALRAELIAVREEKEKANKVLQAINEEMLASNEEFQSLNEELDTSKEEIESANEELITNNQELITRNEQLAEAYDFSEAIVATLHEPILILDKDLRVRSTNKAFCKTFLVQEADTDGKLLYELGSHQWDIPRLRDLLSSLILRKNYFYDYEVTIDFPDIGRKTMLLNARRIIKKVQDEQLILLAFTDTTEASQRRISEKKELEGIIHDRTRELALSIDTLRGKNVTLQKMNKELETFTYISSHDLQEPLRKIKNFATCLLTEEHDALSDSGRMYLDRMNESVIRMQKLIEGLLAYALFKNDNEEFKKTDLNLLVSEVIAGYQDTLHKTKGTIKAGKLCDAIVIPLQYRQLLQNLIGNSLKFCDPGKPPHIFIKSKVAKGSRLSHDDLLPHTRYCHISVTDNGIGFDPRYKDRIFEVFQRLHEYDTYQGTGIGLAICQRIVENHHGIITATALAGGGTTIDIYTPQL